MEIMITDRQKRILNFVVKEYSKKGEPIGSKDLCAKHFQDLSPATLRKELSELTNWGYLDQPHTSAGRIPTNKAYKWFVNEAMANESKIAASSEQWAEKINQDRDMSDDFFSESAQIIADFCGGMGLTYSLEEQSISKYGWKNLVEQLLPDTPENEISRIFEEIESVDFKMDEIFQNISKTGKTVFIGKECPIVKSESISIISKISPTKKDKLFMLVGPKNMLYEKNLAILEAVVNMLDN